MLLQNENVYFSGQDGAKGETLLPDTGLVCYVERGSSRACQSILNLTTKTQNKGSLITFTINIGNDKDCLEPC